MCYCLCRNSCRFKSLCLCVWSVAVLFPTVVNEFVSMFNATSALHPWPTTQRPSVLFIEMCCCCFHHKSVCFPISLSLSLRFHRNRLTPVRRLGALLPSILSFIVITASIRRLVFSTYSKTRNQRRRLYSTKTWSALCRSTWTHFSCILVCLLHSATSAVTAIASSDHQVE